MASCAAIGWIHSCGFMPVGAPGRSCGGPVGELASQQGKERILQSKKGLIGGAAETLDKARRGRAARKHAVEMA